MSDERATATVEVGAEVWAALSIEPAEEGDYRVQAQLYATVGDTDHPAGKAGALVDAEHVADAEHTIRLALATCGLGAPLAKATVPARYAGAVSEGWQGDFEVLVPDACTDPGPPPVFDDTWLMVEAIDTPADGTVVFILAGDPPGIRWAVEADERVSIRVA